MNEFTDRDAVSHLAGARGPVIVAGCTKSGTTLLRNLLDGHRALFAIPFEAHFFQRSRYWVSYSFRHTTPAVIDNEAWRRSLIEWLEFLNGRCQPLADGFVKGRIDVNAAAETLLSEPDGDAKAMCDLYVRAIYAGTRGGELPSGVTFVEKSVENAEFAMDWQAFYPNARFVHILRNPYANLVAIRKYLAKLSGRSTSSVPPLLRAVQALTNACYFMYRNRRLLKNYLVIRYEDLLADPASTMRDVACFLDIDYDETLEQPTLLGEPWGGNASSGRRYTGVSADNLTSWQGDITDIEVRLINNTLSHVLDDYGYPVLPAGTKPLWPARGETLRSYAVNRLALYALP